MNRKRRRRRRSKEQDNKHCVTHMHENEKGKRKKKKIIIHRIIKMMIMKKTNDKHEDVCFPLIDFEYPSTRRNNLYKSK